MLKNLVFVQDYYINGNYDRTCDTKLPDGAYFVFGAGNARANDEYDIKLRTYTTVGGTSDSGGTSGIYNNL